MFRLFSTCIIAMGIGLTAQADEIPTEAKGAEDNGAQQASHQPASIRVPDREIRVPDRVSRVSKGNTRVPQRNTRVPQRNTRVSKGNTRVPQRNTRVSKGNSRVPQRNTRVSQRNTRVSQGKADRIVVYSATWCGPCRRLKPVLMSLKNEGYTVIYRDVDKDRDKLAYEYKALPTIYFVRDGTVIKRETGYQSGMHIKQNLRQTRKTNPLVVLLKNTKTAITTPIVLEGVVETFDLRRLSTEWKSSEKPRR